MKTLSELPRKSGAAEAIRYALARWQALGRFIDDGTVEIDNNDAERAASILSRIETAKLNGIDPEAYLRTVLTNIAESARLGRYSKAFGLKERCWQ